MPVPNPDHLLDQADRLIAPQGRGAPRQADLRRAISAAYYSVFHAIVTNATDDLVGSTQRQTPRYALIYRHIEHKALRSLCEDVKKPSLPARYSKLAPTGGFGPDLIGVAAAVLDLQEKRHLADYDPLFRVGISDAALAVATGRTALVRFRNAPSEPKKVFLSLLVFSPR